MSIVKVLKKLLGQEGNGLHQIEMYVCTYVRYAWDSKIMIKNRYPLSLISEIFDRLRRKGLISLGSSLRCIHKHHIRIKNQKRCYIKYSS